MKLRAAQTIPTLDDTLFREYALPSDVELSQLDEAVVDLDDVRNTIGSPSMNIHAPDDARSHCGKTR